MRWLFIISLLPVLMLGAISCQQTQVTLEDVRLTLDSLEQKFVWLDFRIMQEYWDLYTTGQSDSLDYYRDLYAGVVADDEAFQILKEGERLIDDDVDHRRWEIIFANFLIGRAEDNPSVSALRDSLSRIDIHFRPEFEGEESSADELRRIARHDRSRDRREAAYRASVSLGEEMADGLERLIRMRNQYARKLGYNNFLAMNFSRSEIDLHDHLALLERLDQATSDRYKAILTDAEKTLGYSDIDVWDLGYATADVTSKIDAYFPVDSQMVFVYRSLDSIGFNIDKLPIFIDLESREGRSQFAYAFPIKPPYDIRVMANLYDGIGSITVILHELGHALHSAYVAQDRELFNVHLDGSWTEGMAQIIASLTENRRWLIEVAHVPAGLADEYLQLTKDKEVIYQRQNLTWLMFEYEAYNSPGQDLNKLYWDLYERYVMLPRHDDIYPWAATIHFTTHPVYVQNYLYADIVCAQTLAYFEKNDMNLAGDPSTRSFLIQNYMRFGSRYPWLELLERGTGEPMNPAYFIARMGIE
ncbi:MAG TPA: M3 family metallopeptidase [candidate division Zixibacteria bacterium]|nr:M3 family metallopeptidase [candidate division Zixibacteria bacterium]